MEDLRQTAMAYHIAATDEIRQFIQVFYNEMDPKDNRQVEFKEFSKYMETIGCQHMASDEFFNELKQPGNEVLYYDDIITLFYIIHSGRPFCGGLCKKFVKGMYFTCVKCFSDHNIDSAFSVCSQCFGAEAYQHCHDDFLDPIVLLRYKRIEALKSNLNERSPSSVTTVLMDPSPSLPASSSSSSSHQSHKMAKTNSPIISTAIVPAMSYQQSKQVSF
ncbi:hypothetical protein TIFTF001_050753 [Ficus carica]|uniref:EF-hand domain-containing protein n=1 Tax=Ficus carica TaxID=3494 RepID=A0AA88DAB5_FICCA|nr:hypothetical protein TIFTF001_050753 [Ficus carica]